MDMSIAAAAGADSPLSPPRPVAPGGYTVFIRELSVMTVIGVHAQERTAARALLMDLDIELAACAAGDSDRIEDTVDYSVVVDAVRAELAARSYHLLERVAETVAGLVLGRFGARRVRVRVAKAGILPGVGQVGVMIERACGPQAR
jgi:dihydroneopterin aldolase